MTTPDEGPNLGDGVTPSTSASMHVKASFRVTGSVLNDTIEGEMLGAETTLRLESLNREPLVVQTPR